MYYIIEKIHWFRLGCNFKTKINHRCRGATSLTAIRKTCVPLFGLLIIRIKNLISAILKMLRILLKLVEFDRLLLK